MRRFAAIFIVFFAFSAIAGDKESSRNKMIKDTIMKYNALLSKCYRNLNMAPLMKLATQKQAEKEYVHMEALGVARVKMDSELKSITFLKIIFLSDTNVDAHTSEKWDFRHIHIDTGKTVYEGSAIYELKYSLIKRDGKWVVDSIVSVDKDSPKNKNGHNEKVIKK